MPKLPATLSKSLLPFVIFLFSSRIIEAQTGSSWWPKTGTVMLGGGHFSDSTAADFEKRFVALAGGPKAFILIIPTANPNYSASDLNDLVGIFKSFGAAHVAILNTKDRKVADSDSFVRMIQSATGVFMTGGQSMLLTKIYRGTRVETELKALLDRGGVVAGDSAGSIAIGCMWVTWLPDPYGKRSDELCLLPNVAVSPHSNIAKGFVVDEEVLKYLLAHSTVIGIDLDEDTMLILDQKHAEVIGSGHVSVLDASKNKTGPILKLAAGKPHLF